MKCAKCGEPITPNRVGSFVSSETYRNKPQLFVTCRKGGRHDAKR